MGDVGLRDRMASELESPDDDMAQCATSIVRLQSDLEAHQGRQGQISTQLDKLVAEFDQKVEAVVATKVAESKKRLEIELETKLKLDLEKKLEDKLKKAIESLQTTLEGTIETKMAASAGLLKEKVENRFDTKLAEVMTSQQTLSSSVDTKLAEMSTAQQNLTTSFDTKLADLAEGQTILTDALVDKLEEVKLAQQEFNTSFNAKLTTMQTTLSADIKQTKEEQKSQKIAIDGLSAKVDNLTLELKESSDAHKKAQEDSRTAIKDLSDQVANLTSDHKKLSDKLDVKVVDIYRSLASAKGKWRSAIARSARRNKRHFLKAIRYGNASMKSFVVGQRDIAIQKSTRIARSCLDSQLCELAEFICTHFKEVEGQIANCLSSDDALRFATVGQMEDVMKDLSDLIKLSQELGGRTRASFTVRLLLLSKYFARISCLYDLAHRVWHPPFKPLVKPSIQQKEHGGRH